MKNEFRNWSDTRIFLAVYREGSTLAASRKLGMAQPTVARRVDALEHETGLTLFERDTRGFKPTDDARNLFPLAQAIEEAANNFANKTGELAERRPIRITAPSYFSDKVMAIFSAFAALNPDIAIEFVPSLKILDLLKGEADIAFRVGETNPDGKLIGRKIATAEWTLYGSQSYAEKFGLPKSPDDLADHRFVVLEHEDLKNNLYDWIVHRVSPEQIVMSFSEYDLLLASVRAGHGLSLVHARFADSDDALIRCFGNIEELARPMMMMIAPDAYRRPEVKVFTKFFAPRYARIFKIQYGS